MSETKDAIYAAFDKVTEMYRQTDKLDTCALGVWVDDPKNPGVCAVVRGGKLYSLLIADSYADRMSPSELELIVNATIINAYLEWSADRVRLGS